MKKVQFWKIFFIASTAYIFLIFIAFARQNSSFIHYSVFQWYRDFNTQLQNPYLSRHAVKKKASRSFYYNGQTLAYIQDSGGIEHFLINNGSKNIAANNKFYINYDKTPDSLELYNKFGTKQWSLPLKSYAYISPNSLFIAIVWSDNSTLSLYDINRNVLLEPEYLGKFITDFDFSSFNDSLVIGTIEGNAYFYNPQRKILSQFRQNEGPLDYIKAINISKTGQYIAILSGQSPEKLSLYENKGKANDLIESHSGAENIEKLWSIHTGAARIKKNSMFISENKNLLLEERDGILYSIHLQNGKTLRKKALETHALGKIKYLFFDVAESVYAIAATHEKGERLEIVSIDDDTLLWEKNFADDYLLHIEIVEEPGYIEIILHSSKAIYRYALVLEALSNKAERINAGVF